MFTSEKFEAFMQNAAFAGRGDTKTMRFEFYITPIKYDLAEELSPIIAQSLFTKDRSGKAHPVAGMNGPSFDIGKINLQKMFLHHSADKKMDKHGVMLDRAQLSHISAVKKFLPDSPDFTLIFRVEVPFDELSLSVARRYYDEKVYLTFEEMQLKLPLSANPKCEECENDAVCRDAAGTYFCEKDRKKAKGEVTYIAKKESPVEAQVRRDKEDLLKGDAKTLPFKKNK